VILDDEEVTHDLLTAELGSVGYRLVHHSNGKEAVEQIKRQTFDLLILDIVMPEQDGLETIMIVRKIFPNLKMLVITAHEEYVEVAKLMGATEALAKPLDAQVLRATVGAMLAS
jgi:two-component system chemotaxis response regulator CheY